MAVAQGHCAALAKADGAQRGEDNSARVEGAEMGARAGRAGGDGLFFLAPR